VKAVLAHEMAHVANRDILVTTIAAMIGAAIAAIANILQFSMLFGGSDEDNGPAGMIGALVAIIFAPLAAMVLQLAVSRQREYLADATAAKYIGEGEPLARALETLKRGTEAIPMQVNPATEAMYIANPLSALKGQGMSALFSTHPPMDERIRRLRALDAASGVHYA
jgi:heat shock protein HtpX